MSVNSAQLLLVHPTGSEFSRNAALAFEEAGCLSEFWTSLVWNTEWRLNSILPAHIRRELARRSFAKPLMKTMRTSPFREAGRLLAMKLKLSKLIHHERGICCIDAVYRSLDKRVAQRLNSNSKINTVYGYEDGALEIFRAAAHRGMKCIYDLPIGYWRAGREIQREEAERKPEWASTLSANLDSDEKLERKDQELVLADKIIVASTFTLNTLSQAKGIKAKVSVVPYGSPTVGPERQVSKSGKLKVLFVGILSQRKGISYVFDSVKPLQDHVELTVIGRPPGECAVLNEHLKKHRWIPSLPHAKLIEEMGQHDVLVFPSLFEGFGLVILEAMSRGLPAIVTPHTAGPDFITDGIDGFIVPIRSASAITEKLSVLVRDRQRLNEMGIAARATAQKHSWETYRRKLIESVL